MGHWCGGDQGRSGRNKKLTEALAFYRKHSADELAFLEWKQKPEWLERPQPAYPFLWEAFWVLARGRTMDGWISHDAITRYCDESWLTDPVSRGQVVRVIMALDKAEKQHADTASQG